MTFNVVLDNSGTPLYTTPFTALWRTVTPSGLIAEANTNWLLRDETSRWWTRSQRETAMISSCSRTGMPFSWKAKVCPRT